MKQIGDGNYQCKDIITQDKFNWYSNNLFSPLQEKYRNRKWEFKFCLGLNINPLMSGIDLQGCFFWQLVKQKVMGNVFHKHVTI